MRTITCALFLLWSATNLIYYGTAFGIDELHLSPSAYVSVCIVGLVGPLALSMV